MKILVTGADGMLGNYVTRELLRRGHSIVAMLEPSTKPLFINELDVEIKKGDVRVLGDVMNAAIGCEAIVHCAASICTWPARSKMVNDINYTGTKHIVETCFNLNIKKLIHVGTANSFGFGSIDLPGCETAEYKAWRYGFDYMDSKRKAQEYVLDAVREKGLPAVIVNPTFMFGAFDAKPNAGKMIVAIAKKKIPANTSGGKNFANASDVAIGVCNALTMGEIGECYILGGENLTYKEAFSRIAKAVNIKAPSFTMPDFMVKIYGAISDLLSKITRKEPAVSWKAARISLDHHYYASNKAIAKLGLPQNPIELGIQEYITWQNARTQK